MSNMLDIRSPYTGGKVKEVTTTEVMEYQGRAYTVPVRYYQCVDTGETFSTTEQDQEWYEALQLKAALASLKGCISLPEDFDDKKEIAEYLEAKYQ